MANYQLLLLYFLLINIASICIDAKRNYNLGSSSMVVVELHAIGVLKRGIWRTGLISGRLRLPVERAFKRLASVTRFTFSLSEGGKSDLSIGFFRPNHGDGFPFEAGEYCPCILSPWWQVPLLQHRREMVIYIFSRIAKLTTFGVWRCIKLVIF